MRKRRNRNDPKLVAQFIEEGRGIGRGADYRPFWNTHDFHSRGVRVRARWWLTGRIHHLFSILEYWHFLILAADPTVIDIREQFPLLDFERLKEAAERCRREHPGSLAGSRGNVFTTDLVATRRRGKVLSDEPINIKYQRHSVNPPFVYRKRVEEIYWEPAKLRCLTELDAPYSRVRSAEWILQATWPYFLAELPESQRLDIAGLVRRECEKPHEYLTAVCAPLDRKLMVEPGTCIDVSRWMLAQKRWIPVAGPSPFPSAPLRLAS